MNLIEGLQQEMNRCRDLIKAYEEIGPVGALGKLVIENSIKNGEAAIASGDVVAMVAAYQDLKQRE